MSGVSSMTVTVARSAIQSMDLDELNSARAEEVDGKNRKSLLADIDDEILQRGEAATPTPPAKKDKKLAPGMVHREGIPGAAAANYGK